MQISNEATDRTTVTGESERIMRNTHGNCAELYRNKFENIEEMGNFGSNTEVTKIDSCRKFKQINRSLSWYLPGLSHLALVLDFTIFTRTKIRWGSGPRPHDTRFLRGLCSACCKECFTLTHAYVELCFPTVISKCKLTYSSL